MENRGKTKIIVTFSILFLVLISLLLLIFFAGKKSYVVRFELNGGTLISGSLEQHVVRGQDAVPPTVVKDGAYLRSWSKSHKQVTKDIVIEAVWEYNTTPGIIYSVDENQNFAEIESAYKYIQGEVYLGAYYDDKQILGIRDNAFSDCKGITDIYLLNGLLHIGKEAFSGCTSLTEIEIPKTVVRIGDGAFRDCEELKTLILKEGLQEIGAGAFENCTSLKEVVLPASLVRIDENAFAGCEDLVIKVTFSRNADYELWADGWQGDAEVVWPDDVLPPTEEAPDEDDKIPEDSDSPEDSRASSESESDSQPPNVE